MYKIEAKGKFFRVREMKVEVRFRSDESRCAGFSIGSGLTSTGAVFTLCASVFEVLVLIRCADRSVCRPVRV